MRLMGPIGRSKVPFVVSVLSVLSVPFPGEIHLVAFAHECDHLSEASNSAMEKVAPQMTLSEAP